MLTAWATMLDTVFEFAVNDWPLLIYEALAWFWIQVPAGVAACPVLLTINKTAMPAKKRVK